jgi:hypothetical protein
MGTILRIRNGDFGISSQPHTNHKTTTLFLPPRHGEHGEKLFCLSGDTDKQKTCQPFRAELHLTCKLACGRKAELPFVEGRKMERVVFPC